MQLLRVVHKDSRPMLYYIDGKRVDKDRWHLAWQFAKSRDSMTTKDKNGKFYHYTSVR